MDAYRFWKNVDAVSSGITLISLASKANLNYRTIKNQRSSNRMPSLSDAYALAKALNTSIEFLLTGENFQEVFCAEARAVNEDPELQALVRAVMKDRRLLSALASVITSMEHATAGLA